MNENCYSVKLRVNWTWEEGGTKRRKGDDLSSSEERRWIRKGKCGKGEISWNFKHDAHNGLGHILVYLVIIPTDEVQLLGNSTMLRAPLLGMLVLAFVDVLRLSRKKLRADFTINYRDR